MRAFDAAKGAITSSFKPLTSQPMFLNLGEGAQQGPNGMIYFVDIEDLVKGDSPEDRAGPGIYRFDPMALNPDATINAIQFRPMSGGATCIGFTQFKDILIVGVGKDLKLLNFRTGVEKIIARAPHADHENRFNDGYTSPDGRYFFVGTVGSSKQGGGLNADAHLYAYDTFTNRIHTVLDKTPAGGIQISNGGGWSPDGKKFYYIDLRIDSGTSHIFEYDYDADAPSPDKLLTSGRIFTSFENEKFEPGKNIVAPDGMKVLADGSVLVAMNCVAGGEGGGFVRRYEPDGEKFEDLSVLPGGQTTIPVTFDHHDFGVCMMVATAAEHQAVADIKAAGRQFHGTPHIETNLPKRFEPQQPANVLRVSQNLLAGITKAWGTPTPERK